jgi:hypothetical protein
MSFLAAAPAAAATTAAAAAPATWAATNAAIGAGTMAATATPLAQGVISGAMLAGGAKSLGLLQTLGMSPLGGMASMVPNAATGLGSLAAAAPAAGSTLALEGAKAGIIQNAMAQQVAQNAAMQVAAGGQAAAPGLFNTMGMSPLGGMQSLSPTLASGAYNPAYAQQVAQQAAARGLPPAGSPDVARQLLATTDKATAPIDIVSKAQPGLESAVKGYATSPAYEAQALAARNAAAAQQANAANAARIASDAARSQKMAVEAGLASPIQPGESFLSNLGNLVQNPSMQGAMDYAKEHPYATAGMGYGLYSLMQPKYKPPKQDPGYIRPYDLEVENLSGQPIGESTAEREQLRYKYRPLPIYRAGEEPMADGGLATLANGGTVEQMSRNNAIGGNTMYPLSQQQTPSYSNPQVQVPIPQNVISSAYDAPTNPYTGEVRMAEGGMFGGRGLRAILDAVRNAPSNVQYTYDPNTQQYTQIASDAGSPSGMKGLTALMARLRSAVQPETPPRYDYNPDTQQYTQLAGGGISHLGDYSDGGRLLKGPGDGVSDSIPASIGGRQPARLANNEFVIPARIVSEIGNGSTDAGAKKLYAMMDRVQKRRAKTIGKGKVAVDSKAHKEVDRL